MGGVSRGNQAAGDRMDKSERKLSEQWRGVSGQNQETGGGENAVLAGWASRGGLALVEVGPWPEGMSVSIQMLNWSDKVLPFQG